MNDDYGFEVGDGVIVACYNLIKANVEKLLTDAVIGRAYGDEFVVFARAEKDEIEKAAQAIFKDFDSYNFSAIGCKKQVGGYIGGITGRRKSCIAIREMLDNSHEVLQKARENGRNSAAVRVQDQ